MKNVSFLAVLAILLIWACQPSAKKETMDLDALRKEVMDVHDEVMPKMGELRKLAKALRERAESMEESDAAPYIEIAEQIEKANAGMMSWMRSYEPGFTGTDDEIKAYLDDQLLQITQVKNDMMEGLDAGKSLLN